MLTYCQHGTCVSERMGKNKIYASRSVQSILIHFPILQENIL